MDKEDEEAKVRKRIDKQEKQRRQEENKKKDAPSKTNQTRYDVLAKPQQRNMLGTYQSHAYHFPQEKVDKLKRKLQELFGLTAAETDQYFEQMKKAANKKSSNARYDVLATPHKRAVLGTYQSHAYHFPKEKVEKLKRKLQELGMTPEETDQYVEQMKKKPDKDESNPRYDVLARPQKRNILGTYQGHAYHFPKKKVEKLKKKLQELFGMTEEEIDQYIEQMKKKKKPDKEESNPRYDKLAKPQKRNMLGTYQSHAYHFPKEKREKLKKKLQELFGMSAEEADKYLENMEKEKKDGGGASGKYDKLATPQKRQILGTYQSHAYHFPKEKVDKLKSKLKELGMSSKEIDKYVEQMKKEPDDSEPSERYDELAKPHKRAILGTYQSHAYHFPKERTKKIKRKLKKLFGMTTKETDQYFEHPKRDGPYKTRYDVLATPHKRAILGTYQSHAYHFPKEKVTKLKRKLQELFAMTPEETEKYFEQMRNEENEIAKRKMEKIMMKMKFEKLQHVQQEKKAYKFVAKLLKRKMMEGFTKRVPPLISVRLRNLSDIILQQICDLRNIDMPNREKPDQRSMFLLSFADWTSIGIEQVYYGVQIKKNQELQKIEEEEAMKPKGKKVEKKEEKKEEKKKPVAISGGEEFDLLEQDLE